MTVKFLFMGKRKKENKMKALERSSLHLPPTTNICNAPMDSKTCENYKNVKIAI